jgi:hypothetical protein
MISYGHGFRFPNRNIDMQAEPDSLRASGRQLHSGQVPSGYIQFNIPESEDLIEGLSQLMNIEEETPFITVLVLLRILMDIDTTVVPHGAIRSARSSR